MGSDAGKPLKQLTNAKLRQFGASLKFYPGLPGIFNDLRKSVAEHHVTNPHIEFYVISGGLEEVIRGCKIAKYFSGVWGCEFAEEDGEIRYMKNIVSFTEKTKYLFQINKGLPENAGPYDVNQLVEQPKRRIPWDQIIYVGDGLTDVPCFSLVDHFGGLPFGVFDPKKAGSPKKAWEGLITPKRVKSMNAPKFRRDDELGSLLRAAVKGICLRMDSQTGTVR
jgi:hypothetical protein